MKYSADILRRLHWMQLPGAFLIALLQRTPVLRVVETASDFVLRSPAASVLKAAAASLGAMGAVHTLAGATTLSASSPSPTSATVGTTKTVVFSAIGAQSSASSWTVGGSVPPGLSFNGGKTSGTVNTSSPTLLTLTGIPTTAGTYVISLRAWEKTNAGGAGSPTFSYTVNVTGGAVATAPAFTTQPSAQTVTAGGSATFTVAASGSPTPTYQWQKNGGALGGQTGPTLSLSNVQVADAGSYTCVATNSAGVVTSAGATLTVAISTSAPMFTTQPGAQTANAGGSATFSVVASGLPAPTYQWLKDGVAIAGETSASLTLANVQASAAGSYTCTATNSAGTVTSPPATLAISAAAVQSVISNVSVRTTLEASQTLIVGFTMQGGSKSVLVRAVGPGLANFGVAGAMFDPRLALYRGSDMLMQNDDWGGGSGLSNAFSRVGAFPLTPASHDAAVMRSVEGGHTVQISGSEGGNVLVEAYDAGTGTAAHLVNVSARNRVGTGGDILIAGFTISGAGSRNLLVRAVGPTLAAFGVPGTLVAPKLEIYNTAGEKIAENDGWAAALASAFSRVGAFPLTAGSHDAALTISLPPGGYTVQVAGADGGTGEALVELYELP